MRPSFETSIATVCLSGNLQEKISAISKAGFDSIELWENDLLQFPGTPADIRRICQKLGMRISAYQPFRDLEGLLDPIKRRRTFEKFERKLQLAQELGTDCILLCSNVGECSGDQEIIAKDLWEAAERAKRYNVKIAYEALGWGETFRRILMC
jgi:4-hydroxyphenylpyruvate dioxygenase